MQKSRWTWPKTYIFKSFNRPNPQVTIPNGLKTPINLNTKFYKIDFVDWVREFHNNRHFYEPNWTTLSMFNSWRSFNTHSALFFHFSFSIFLHLFESSKNKNANWRKEWIYWIVYNCLMSDWCLSVKSKCLMHERTKRHQRLEIT